MKSYLSAVAVLNRNVRLLLVVMAASGIGFMGIAGVLLNLYVLRLGYTVEFLGVLGGVGFAVYAIMALPAGAIGTRIGGRRALILGISTSTIGFVLFLLAESLPIEMRATALVVTNAIAWLGGAFSIVNMTPLMAAHTQPEERGLAFSLMYALLSIFGFIGSLVGGVLPGIISGMLGVTVEQAGPYRLSLMLVPIAYLLSLLAILASGEPDTGNEAGILSGMKGSKPALPAAARPYALIIVIGLILVLRMTSEQATGFFNVYLDDALSVSTGLIGLVVAVSRLLVGLATLAAPWLIARRGLVNAFVIATLAQAVSVLPLALIPLWPAATLGFLGISLMAAFSAVIISAFHQQIVEPEWRSIMSGGASLAGGIGQAAILFGGGFFIAGAGYTTFFLVCGGITFLAAILFWSYFRVPRGTFASAPPAELPPSEPVPAP